MKLTTVGFLCAVIALLLSACTQSAPTTSASKPASAPSAAAAPAAPAELAAAKANFTKNCEACHGETGEGGVVKVDDKKLKVPSLKADHAVKHTDDQYLKQITKGGDGMPSFKDKLKPEEMQELIKYIRKEFQGGK